MSEHVIGKRPGVVTGDEATVDVEAEELELVLSTLQTDDRFLCGDMSSSARHQYV